MVAKIYTSKRWLYKKFVTERLSEEQIAKIANTNQSTIHRWLKFHNIRRRTG